MSEQNKSILQQANAAMTKGDYETFLSHCTDDTTWHFIGDQTLRGKDAVRQYIKDTYHQPPTFSVSQLIADETHVTALGQITLKDKSGRPTHSHYCDVWTIRDNQLAELQAFVIEIPNQP